MTRAHVIFSGRVQGGGFRWTTLRVSRGFAVTGFVKNLPDGTVELAAEGDQAEVQRFLDAVAGELASNIDHTDLARSESSGASSSFDIAR